MHVTVHTLHSFAHAHIIKVHAPALPALAIRISALFARLTKHERAAWSRERCKAVLAALHSFCISVDSGTALAAHAVRHCADPLVEEGLVALCAAAACGEREVACEHDVYLKLFQLDPDHRVAPFDTVLLDDAYDCTPRSLTSRSAVAGASQPSWCLTITSVCTGSRGRVFALFHENLASCMHRLKVNRKQSRVK